MHGARLHRSVGLPLHQASSTSTSDRRTRDTTTTASSTPPNGFRRSTPLTATTEQLIALEAGVTNDMVGGQLGMHWDKDYRSGISRGTCKVLRHAELPELGLTSQHATTIYGGTVPQTDTMPDTVL